MLSLAIAASLPSFCAGPCVGMGHHGKHVGDLLMGERSLTSGPPRVAAAIGSGRVSARTTPKQITSFA